MLKYHLLRIQNDDLSKMSKDPEYIETITAKGFEELFLSKKTRSARKRESRSRSRKNRKKNKKEELDIDIKEMAVKSTLEQLDHKLYGLIIPKAGDLLPKFFDMIKLMVKTN